MIGSSQYILLSMLIVLKTNNQTYIFHSHTHYISKSINSHLFMPTHIRVKERRDANLIPYIYSTMNNNLPYNTHRVSPKKPQPSVLPTPSSPILTFAHHSYPFPNHTSSQLTALKTVVNVSLNPLKLQKIVRLNHPNIIGIRKIVKSSGGEGGDAGGVRQYSFYYEVVHFSLLALCERPETNPRLSNLLFACDLCGVLRSVVGYLQELGIYYKPKLQDIGISVEGNLKLFVSPLVIFDSKYETGVLRLLQEIAEWWQNYLEVRHSNIFRKEKRQLQPPQLANNHDLEFEEPSVPDSTLEKQLGDLLAEEEVDKQPKVPLNSSTNSLSKIGTSQLQKIKLIDQEVKFIRERLTQKQSKVYSQKNPVEPDEQSTPYPPSKEQKLHRQEVKPEKYFREPIQQNINCINIYNQNNHIAPLPPRPQLPSANNLHHPLRLNHPPRLNNNYFDPHFIRQHHDDQDSQDTYDIEFDQPFETPEHPTPIPQNNRGRDRELSEYSVQARRKNKEGEKGNKKTNRVCNKNYTESAGPLQFKSLMGRYLLPEDKEANQEDQGNRGIETGKKEGASISNYTPQSIRSATIDKTIKQPILRNNVESVCVKAQKIKRIHSQNQLAAFKAQGGKETEIQERVKRALEKTKNAIALLNRVKSSKTTGMKTNFQ